MEGGLFDATMEAVHEAEVFETIGNFLLYQLSKIIIKTILIYTETMD